MKKKKQTLRRTLKHEQRAEGRCGKERKRKATHTTGPGPVHPQRRHNFARHQMHSLMIMPVQKERKERASDCVSGPPASQTIRHVMKMGSHTPGYSERRDNHSRSPSDSTLAFMLIIIREREKRNASECVSGPAKLSNAMKRNAKLHTWTTHSDDKGAPGSRIHADHHACSSVQKEQREMAVRRRK
jgi:hypothetical protein